MIIPIFIKISDEILIILLYSYLSALYKLIKYIIH